MKNNRQIGYEPSVILTYVDHNLIEFIQKYNIQLIVASRNIMQDENAVKRFYEALPLGVSVIDFPSFYEMIMEKVPVSAINETWFLENLMEINKRTFEAIKRGFDIILAILLGIPTILLFPLAAILIKAETPGPALYRQKRVGKNGEVFEAIKFRSMINNAEKEKTGWIKPEKGDCRVTRIGNILRKTRIDELPQIWNVLKGEMSFIGPRPERPEFVKELEQQIPYYAMRHLVKPGLSGWAQINFSDASAKDALEKLQYDLYYIKNRSLVLDLAIAAKTIATIVGRTGR